VRDSLSCRHQGSRDKGLADRGDREAAEVRGQSDGGRLRQRHAWPRIQATTAGHQLMPLSLPESQGLGQSPHRQGVGRAAHAPFQVGDASGTQPGPLRQLFLGEPRRLPMLLQQHSEWAHAIRGCRQYLAPPPRRAGPPHGTAWSRASACPVRVDRVGSPALGLAPWPSFQGQHLGGAQGSASRACPHDRQISRSARTSAITASVWPRPRSHANWTLTFDSTSGSMQMNVPPWPSRRAGPAGGVDLRPSISGMNRARTSSRLSPPLMRARYCLLRSHASSNASWQRQLAGSDRPSSTPMSNSAKAAVVVYARPRRALRISADWRARSTGLA
jgi:hypothetical protein